MSTDDLISQVVEVCNVAPTRAALALGKCRNSVEYAINWIYENPEEVEAPPPSPLPPVPKPPRFLSPEEQQWRRFDRSAQTQLSMLLFALNVNAWDSQDFDSFVPYDALEECLPCLLTNLEWTFQNATMAAGDDVSLRSIFHNRKPGEPSSSPYHTDVSVECFDPVNDPYPDIPRFVFVRIAMSSRSWVHDMKMVASGWNCKDDVWNKSGSEPKFERFNDPGLYAFYYSAQHKKQYLFHETGTPGVFKPYKNGASIPLPKDGSVPCHLAVSLFRDGTSSAQLVTMPDNFAVPMHHHEKCFDLELDAKRS